MGKLPLFIGGIGEKNYGGKYRMGNRIYSIKGISPTLLATSRGNISGYSPLILVKKSKM